MSWAVGFILVVFIIAAIIWTSWQIIDLFKNLFKDE